MADLSGLLVEAIERYAQGVRAKIARYWAEYEFSQPQPAVVVSYMRRYARVEKHDSQVMVHTFIDLANGDVLKAEGWKKPERKNPRGNVFAPDNGLSRVTWHGAEYLR